MPENADGKLLRFLAGLRRRLRETLNAAGSIAGRILTTAVVIGLFAGLLERFAGKLGFHIPWMIHLLLLPFEILFAAVSALLLLGGMAFFFAGGIVLFVRGLREALPRGFSWKSAWLLLPLGLSFIIAYSAWTIGRDVIGEFRPKQHEPRAAVAPAPPDLSQASPLSVADAQQLILNSETFQSDSLHAPLSYEQFSCGLKRGLWTRTESSFAPKLLPGTIDLSPEAQRYFAGVSEREGGFVGPTQPHMLSIRRTALRSLGILIRISSISPRYPRGTEIAVDVRFEWSPVFKPLPGRIVSCVRYSEPIDGRATFVWHGKWQLEDIDATSDYY